MPHYRLVYHDSAPSGQSETVQADGLRLSPDGNWLWFETRHPVTPRRMVVTQRMWRADVTDVLVEPEPVPGQG